MCRRANTSIIVTVALASATLAGCAPVANPADDGVISIVASTNVYGDMAARIGGDLVEVTSIIDDPSQDPHSFEADARVQLALSKADIVIENGGGYDAFVDRLLSSLDVPGQVVIDAVEASPLSPSTGDGDGDGDGDGEGDGEGEHSDDGHSAFNEHVWYHFPTMTAVAGELRDALINADPHNGAEYERNAAVLLEDLDDLQQRASALQIAHEGTGVAITEPLPLYLLKAVGLNNLTPADFSTAIEGGSEVSPAALNRALALLKENKAKLLVYNDQTTSPETETMLAAAERANIPIVSVSELLPAGSTYIDWMNGVLNELQSALETR